ncbi:CBS domain-containing protein [Candidatus Bathyarchaeota archaeon]|nr:CBS domain-containing protein [Candidatus Bathyarchaeota archaeon]
MEALKRIEVRELSTPPVTVPPTYTISKIVGKLKETNAYEAFVVEKDKVGMVTIRDILRASQIEGVKIAAVTKYPTKLSPTASLGQAARIMTDYRLRALPIVEDGEVTGAVTAKRVLEFILEKAPLNFQVGSLASGNLTMISESDTVAKARNLMVEKKIDHIPVTSDKKVSGIVTSSQIVFSLVPRERIGSETVGLEGLRILGFQARSLMDSDLVLFPAEKGASEALRGMLRTGRTYSLITVLDMVQGIVTPRDYVKILAEPEAKAEIPVYIVGLPEDPFESEVAKSKFLNVAATLNKAFPEIEEARSIIKTSESVKGKERRRYEVDVALTTARGVITYTHTGWDLSDIYDELAVRLKRLLTEKQRSTRRYLRRGLKKMRTR